MKSSLITKKRIAKSLKQLMQHKEFEQLSITEIMRHSEMRRQTFYSYFLDKYELLEWIFETELKEQVSDNLNYISSERLIEQLLLFFDDNQAFYKKLFELSGQNSFEAYFVTYCATIIEKYLLDHPVLSHSLQQTQKERFIRYHSSALASYIQQALNNHTLKPKIDGDLIITFLSGSLTMLQTNEAYKPLINDL